MTIKGLKYYLTNPKRIYAFFASRKMLNWMSDESFLKLAFRMNMGYKLNLENPKTFNEKLQWLKLNDRNPDYTRMVDKYAAKELIAECIGNPYIIPTLGVWDRYADIDFETLPNQFVLKCTHDSGNVIICREKSTLDIPSARSKINKSMQRNYYYSGSREWPYKDVKPRIIAEVYMEDENATIGLTDYKFFCFNGEPKIRNDYKPIVGDMKLPNNFLEMTQVARKLAIRVGCPFVRIDLYSVRGKIYFSEVTFSPCAGMLPFKPAQWDEHLGTWIQLPEK